jgi:transcriptional regulator with XRE-family HTH domain
MGKTRFNITGSYVAKIRHELGWSQEILAARLQREGLDVSRQMLANMESDRTQMPDYILIGLQKVFRIPLIRLFSIEVQRLDEEFARRENDRLDGPRRRRQ